MCPYLFAFAVSVAGATGVNLKVITGHPEHDLLFIAKQVADAAGLNHSSQVVSAFVKQGGKTFSFMRLGELYNNIIDLKAELISPNGKAYGSNTYIMTEPQVYKMLMRGHAPQSEPFRKWVTEEVLPTLRKTGRYDIAGAANAVSTAESNLKSIAMSIPQQPL